MAGSPNEVTRETRPCWWVWRAYRPRTWRAGVRASVVAMKRGTTVEPRARRKGEVRWPERRKRKPTRVPERASRWWNQPSLLGRGDTERRTAGLGDEAKSRSPSTEHPPTGKPDAGEPPVRFGGRGSGQVRSPYPYLFTIHVPHLGVAVALELRRGLGSAQEVVVLIDGAHGLENMGYLNFKDCVQIVDFFHAMEHAGLVLEALLGKAHPESKSQLRSWAKRLLKDQVERLIEETRQECAGQPQAQAVEEALHYFVSNVARMQYGTFRKAGYFIGSGVVEAGCKTVIGGRCKQSGMFCQNSFKMSPF